MLTIDAEARDGALLMLVRMWKGSAGGNGSLSIEEVAHRPSWLRSRSSSSGARNFSILQSMPKLYLICTLIVYTATLPVSIFSQHCHRLVIHQRIYSGCLLLLLGLPLLLILWD